MRIASPLLCCGAAVGLLLGSTAHARDLGNLFDSPARVRLPPAKEMVESAFLNVFAPDSVMMIETVRTKAEGGTENAKFRVLRRSVNGTLRVLTESLAPETVAGTRVLQIEQLDGMETTFAFVRSLGREPFETTFRLADPFLCTWYEKDPPTGGPDMQAMGRHEILARRPDRIADEPVQRVMIRPFVARGYDRIELAIAESDYAILEYVHFLNPEDTTPSLIATADRKDMVEVGGRVVPRILRYDDRLLGDRVVVTVEHAPLPTDFPNLLFEPRSFHRARTDGLGEQSEF